MSVFTIDEQARRGELDLEEATRLLEMRRTELGALVAEWQKVA